MITNNKNLTMNKLKLPLMMLFIAITSVSFSQKIKIEEGNLDFLKGVTELNVVYDYSEMAVGKYSTEAEYLDKKVGEKNKKEAGTGDKFLASWNGSRVRVYQPKFESLFNKVLAKKNLTIAEGRTDAKYTLIVKTTFTEPGFNIGITKRPSAVSFEYILVETGKDNIMCKMVQFKVPGSQAAGFDYDTSTRISESYAKGGKMVAGFIYKKIK